MYHTRAGISRLLSLLLALFAFGSEALRAEPVEIRLTAGVVAYNADNLTASAFLASTHTAAYDIVWRGDMFGSVISYDGPPLVLFAGGEAHSRYVDGSGDCDGSFARNPDITFFPRIRGLEGDRLQMEIDLPQVAGNTGTTAFLMDSNVPIPFDCRVPKSAFIFGPLVAGGCRFSPDFAASGDEDPSTRCVNHGTKAIFEISQSRRSDTIQFTYAYNAVSPNDQGGVDAIKKLVWFGQLLVSPRKSAGAPGGVDPFDAFDYTVPEDPIQPPPDPGTMVTPPPDPGYDPRDILPWFKDLRSRLEPILRILKAAGGVSSAPALAPLTSQSGDDPPFSFDAATGVLQFADSGLEPVAHSGTARVHVIVRGRGKAKGFRGRVAKSSLVNAVAAGQTSMLNVLLDPKAIRGLDSKRTQTAFIAIDFTPDAGGKRAKRAFRVSLPARRGARR